MKKLSLGLFCVFVAASFLSCGLFGGEDTLFHAVNVVPLNLSETAADFRITYIGNNQDEFQFNAVLESGPTADVQQDSKGNYLVYLENLEQGTAYELLLISNEEELESIPFRTFDTASPISLFYFIDISTPETSLVNVTILGRVEGFQSHTLEPKGYHTNGEFMYVVENPVINVTGPASVTYSPDLDKISIENITGTSYFSVSYTSDKSYRDTGNHGCQGILSKTYFMVSGEQLLYVPTTLYPAVPGQLFGSLIMPPAWESAVEFESKGRGVFDFCFDVPSEIAWTNNEALSTSHLVAFNPSVFGRLIREIYGVQVSVISQNSIQLNRAENVIDIYENVADIWGGNSPGDSKYTIFLVDDDRAIYGGEWTTGQGFSTAFGIEGEMLVHQIYHRWNAWQYGLGFDPSPDGIFQNQGFWIEGLNEFFCDQVLFNLGFDPEHNTMAGFYNQYKQMRGTEDDQSLLENPLKAPLSVYYKGAVYAYHLNQYIRENSGSTADLTDVTQRVWQEWIASGNPLTYDRLFSYVTDLLITGKTGEEWMETYLTNNTPIILAEFE